MYSEKHLIHTQEKPLKYEKGVWHDSLQGKSNTEQKVERRLPLERWQTYYPDIQNRIAIVV
jgi:hypothetical protein